MGVGGILRPSHVKLIAVHPAAVNVPARTDPRKTAFNGVLKKLRWEAFASFQTHGAGVRTPRWKPL